MARYVSVSLCVPEHMRKGQTQKLDVAIYIVYLHFTTITGESKISYIDCKVIV